MPGMLSQNEGGVDRIVSTDPGFIDICNKISGLLNDVLSGGSAKIRSATSQLKPLFDKPVCFPSLLQILITDEKLRELASVELLKKFKFYDSLSVLERKKIKAILMDLCIDRNNVVGKHFLVLCRILAKIASVDYPKGEFVEFLDFVSKILKSSIDSQRYVGFALLYLTIGEIELYPSISHYISHLSNGLTDGLKEIRVFCFKSVSTLGELIEPDDSVSIKNFNKLLPLMVESMKMFLSIGDEDSFIIGVETFNELIAVEKILNEFAFQLIDFFLGIAVTSSYPENVRMQSLTFIMWAIAYKKRAIPNSATALSSLLQSLLSLISEDEPEDLDEDCVSRMACKVLNTLSLNFPSKRIFPTLWPLISACLSDENAACPSKRKAAMMALAVVMEGSADFVLNEFKLENLIPFIVKGLQDSTLVVRRAASMALGCVSDELGHELSEFHAILLPLLFGNLNDSNTRIRKVSLETLDTFLCNLGDKIKPYLNDLMCTLIFMLDQAESLEVKQTIVGAIGSAAVASEADFRPFFEPVITRIKHFVSLEGEDEALLSLRGIATDTTAYIASAVGPEMFRPFLLEFMEYAMNGIRIGTCRLPESSFCFFGTMSSLFKKEFSPFMEPVVASLFESIEQPESELPDNGETSDNEMLDDEDVYADSAISEEKAMAIDTLGAIFESTGDIFRPYVGKLVETLKEYSDHGDENVRKSCIQTAFKIINTFCEMYHPDLEWQKNQQYKLHPDVESLICMFMAEALRTYEEEEDSSVICTLNESIQESLNVVGPHLLAGTISMFSARLLDILCKKSACQMDFDDDGADDEQTELERVIITSTADLIGSCALTLRQPFAEYFTMFWPHIASFYDSSKPTSDRCMAIGVIGEVTAGIQEYVTPFSEEMLKVVIPALSDPDREVRSNACYAIGLICLNTKIDITNRYPEILGKLSTIFNQQQGNCLTDNACGAVCRMIVASPECMPVNDVLGAVLDYLPLKEDFAEWEAVFSCLHSQFVSKNPLIMENVSKIFHVMVEAITTPDVNIKEASKEQIIHICKSLTSDTLQALMMQIENPSKREFMGNLIMK